MLDNLLDPILNPLLVLGPFWAILIISFFVSIFTVIIYKYTTDQVFLRKLKADLKRYQKQATEFQKTAPDKALKLQKKMMKLNGTYMKASFKSTLYTFIPLLIFFGWLGSSLAFAPLVPGSSFNVSVDLVAPHDGSFVLLVPQNISAPVTQVNISNSSTLVFSNISASSQGLYEFSVIDSSSGEEHFFNVLVSNYFYSTPIIPIEGSDVFKDISISLKPLKVFDGVFFFKDLPWIKSWGWLGAYILFSFIFSTLLRKLLKLA